VNWSRLQLQMRSSTVTPTGIRPSSEVVIEAVLCLCYHVWRWNSFANSDLNSFPAVYCARWNECRIWLSWPKSQSRICQCALHCSKSFWDNPQCRRQGSRWSPPYNTHSAPGGINGPGQNILMGYVCSTPRPFYTPVTILHLGKFSPILIYYY